MDKPVRFWIRRAIVSVPFWLFLTYQSDHQRYDDGRRVFPHHQAQIIWTVAFILLWACADLFVTDLRASYQQTDIDKEYE